VFTQVHRKGNHFDGTAFCAGIGAVMAIVIAIYIGSQELKNFD